MTYKQGLLINGVSQPQIHKHYQGEAYKIQTHAIPSNLTMTGKPGGSSKTTTPRIEVARRIYDLYNFYGSVNHTPKRAVQSKNLWI